MISRIARTAFRLPRYTRGYASEASSSEKLKLSFALPHQTLFQDQEVLQVSVPAQTGEMGILANHVPSVEALQPGVVEVVQGGGQTSKYFISSGFASVHPNNSLTINAVEAYELGAFDINSLKSSLSEAQKVLSGNGSEVEKAEAGIEVELYQTLEAALK